MGEPREVIRVSDMRLRRVIIVAKLNRDKNKEARHPKGKKPRRKTGTREWAEVNKNIALGCEHNCQYCYARANALRFKRLDKREDWDQMILNDRALSEKPKKVKGRIMFPTTHDITPKILTETICYLRGWLEAGNEILIVSKPHLQCITEICDYLREYKDQIVFRFTIGSMDGQVLKFWEPGAPSFIERFDALMYAYNQGYKTSVSCEPYLDNTIQRLVHKLLPYITDTIWIGKMNRISQRVSSKEWTEEEFEYLQRVLDVQTDEYVMKLYDVFKNNPKVMWKESIQKVLGIGQYDGVK